MEPPRQTPLEDAQDKIAALETQVKILESHIKWMCRDKIDRALVEASKSGNFKIESAMNDHWNTHEPPSNIGTIQAYYLINGKPVLRHVFWGPGSKRPAGWREIPPFPEEE